MEQYGSMYEEQQQGSVAKGLLGALAGAIIGALLWGVVGILTQRVFALLGVALGFLVAKGYELLKGREGAAKIAIVILCVILSVVLGELLYYVVTCEIEFAKLPEYIAEELTTRGIDVSTVPQEVFDAALPTKAEYYQAVLEDEEMRSSFVKDLLMSLFFAALGAGGVIVDMAKKNQQPQPAAVAQLEEETQESDDQSAAV